MVKKDTIDISKEESYFLYTLDVIHVFKNKVGKTGKTVNVIMKRDLEWEYAPFRDAFNDPFYLRVGVRNIFFLKKNEVVLKEDTNDLPYYQLYNRYTSSRVFFSGSIRDTFKATGLDLGFVTLQDLYLFIRSLPKTTVSDSLIKASQYRIETL